MHMAYHTHLNSWPFLLLLQSQGNNKLRVGLKSKNRMLLREAVEAYSKGLALKCSDVQVGLLLLLLLKQTHLVSLGHCCCSLLHAG
jgi:hypothetical protein